MASGPREQGVTRPVKALRISRRANTFEVMKLHLRHILVEHKYEAEDLEKKLADGADFADLARKFSKCPTSKEGGELGLIELSRLDSDFAETAARLGPNETSGPVRTRFGYHLIWRS
jgi:peptidyl-prolyl cis-trans isomerase C